MHSGWLSNTYLVADERGGHAVVVDTGGPSEPIIRKIEDLDLTLTHILCTHHHYDHVAHNAEYRERFGSPICGHASEKALFGGLDQPLEHNEVFQSGKLTIRALHIPGHTEGQLAFVVNDKAVFTGDTLFKGSVGGTRAPGHATFKEIRHSIMEILMKLPKQMEVYPGHTDSTTIGREWEENPFVRAWRELDPLTDSKCIALGKSATLLLRATDYDGGTKCWVRYEEGGDEDIVPGSRVQDV